MLFVVSVLCSPGPSPDLSSPILSYKFTPVCILSQSVPKLKAAWSTDTTHEAAANPSSLVLYLFYWFQHSSCVCLPSASSRAKEAEKGEEGFTGKGSPQLHVLVV